MSIIVKEKKGNGTNLLTPAGTHQAICYGTWDLGDQETKFGLKHQIVIAWEIDQVIQEEGKYLGKRYVISQKYTLSLHEKSNLRKHLESWRGKKFNDDELKNGFDIEKLIGVNCLLGIVHSETPDRTYANVGAIMPIAKDTKKMIVENDPAPPEWVQKLMDKTEIVKDTFEGKEVFEEEPDTSKWQKEVEKDLENEEDRTDFND